MLCGGNVTSNPAATQTRQTSSTSSTHTDIHAPLSPVSSPSTWNVVVFVPLPRPPCAPTHKKISHSPEPTAPNVGGVPQSQSFFHPHFSNHAKLAAISDTFNIGVIPFAFMRARIALTLGSTGTSCLCSSPSADFPYSSASCTKSVPKHNCFETEFALA